MRLLRLCRNGTLLLLLLVLLIAFLVVPAFSPPASSAPLRPDLSIIDVWYYGSTPGVYTEIRYMLENEGAADAGPSTTALYIDGVKVGEHRADNIDAGEWRVEMLQYSGECSGASDEFGAIADFYNEVTESDETNNDRYRTYSCPGVISLPDLVMLGPWHEGEEEYYYETRQYTAENNIRFRVSNSGDASSPRTEARLYVDGTWSSTHSIPALDPGEEYEGGFGYIGACSGTSDTIRVVVDPSNTIAELNETNNEQTKVWNCLVEPPSGELPDLRLRRAWLTPLEDGEYRIGYRIENLGPGYAPLSSTGLYIDDDFHVESSVEWLAPGEGRDLEFWWTYRTAACTGSDDIINIVADYANAIDETNEANNEYSLTMHCPEPTPIPKPDLVIRSVWYESDPGPFPQNLYIRYSIANQGSEPAGPSVTRLHINYHEIATSDVPALDPGEVLGMVTFTTRWTPQSNDNHVQICADVYNDVDEITPEPSAEMNNCLEEDWVFDLSCHDGVQNRDEEGVDCEGTLSNCPPCNRCDLDTLPSSFDWRDYYVLPPIKDQRHCGSCWAFSPLGAIECTYVVESGLIIDLSEQEFVSQCGCAGSCNGGWPHDVLNYIIGSGVVDEACFPYQSGNCMYDADPGTEYDWRCCDGAASATYGCTACTCDGKCANPCACNRCVNWSTRQWTIAAWSSLSWADDYEREDIKRALICHGPLSVCSANWHHCVVIVGYNDADSCWIIRNSWGIGYEDNGYGEVPYTGHDYSDIRDYVIYVRGVVSL